MSVLGIARSRRGSVLLEFAFVLVVGLGLAFGIIDVSRALGTAHTAASLSREAANLASRGTDMKDAVDAIVDAAAPLDLKKDGAVIISRLEKKGGNFELTDQRSSPGPKASRIGKKNDLVDLPDQAAYPEGTILYAAEVLIDFQIVTPFEGLVDDVLPEEIYESAIF